VLSESPEHPAINSTNNTTKQVLPICFGPVLFFGNAKMLFEAFKAMLACVFQQVLLPDRFWPLNGHLAKGIVIHNGNPVFLEEVENIASADVRSGDAVGYF